MTRSVAPIIIIAALAIIGIVVYFSLRSPPADQPPPQRAETAKPAPRAVQEPLALKATESPTTAPPTRDGESSALERPAPLADGPPAQPAKEPKAAGDTSPQTLSARVAEIKRIREQERLEKRGKLPSMRNIDLLVNAADPSLQPTPEQVDALAKASREMTTQMQTALADVWAEADRLEERYLRLFYTDDGRYGHPGTEEAMDLEKQIADLDAREQETVLALDSQFQMRMNEILTPEQAGVLADPTAPQNARRLPGEPAEN